MVKSHDDIWHDLTISNNVLPVPRPHWPQGDTVICFCIAVKPSQARAFSGRLQTHSELAYHGVCSFTPQLSPTEG